MIDFMHFVFVFSVTCLYVYSSIIILFCKLLNSGFVMVFSDYHFPALNENLQPYHSGFSTGRENQGHGTALCGR